MKCSKLLRDFTRIEILLNSFAFDEFRDEKADNQRFDDIVDQLKRELAIVVVATPLLEIPLLWYPAFVGRRRERNPLKNFEDMCDIVSLEESAEGDKT